MKRVLLTGMSGTGKSTLVRELAARGYKAIDTDYGGWSRWINMRTGLPAAAPAAGEYGWDELDWVWEEGRIQSLLSTEDADVLFLSGTAPNQGKFYPQFDHIILLSAPAEAIARRLSVRTDNPYGKHPGELARVLEHKQTVEPRLRERATAEIDTSAPVEQVVAAVLKQVDSGR